MSGETKPVAAPLRALVEAADEADRRYDAMFGDSASAHPDLPEVTQPLDPAMARLLARLVEDDGYVTDSERRNLRTLLPLLRVHCRAWDYATPTPRTEPAGPAGDNDEADAQFEFTFGDSARAYHPSPTPVPAPSPPAAMPPPAADITPNAIERGAATLMLAPPAVRRPLAPALQQLIMSSAPMRNDGTYDMTEPERLAHGARYRRITGAADATLQQPAAVPPPAANAARGATARPQSDPHGNGVRIGEAHVPAPSADTSDADAPAPPPADTGARSALLRSRSPPARIERTRNQQHLRAQRHRVLLELLAYEEGLMRDAWAADMFDVSELSACMERLSACIPRRLRLRPPGYRRQRRRRCRRWRPVPRRMHQRGHALTRMAMASASAKRTPQPPVPATATATRRLHRRRQPTRSTPSWCSFSRASLGTSSAT